MFCQCLGQGVQWLNPDGNVLLRENTASAPAREQLEEAEMRCAVLSRASLSQLVEDWALTICGSLCVRFCRAADRHDRPDQGAKPQPGDPLPGVQALCHQDILPQSKETARVTGTSLLPDTSQPV